MNPSDFAGKLYTRKVCMQQMLLGEVNHEVKVTAIKGVGLGVRVFTNGKLNQEVVVDNRIKIGPAIRDLLRMEDKCGNISKMADRSRFRPGEKEVKSKYEKRERED